MDKNLSSSDLKKLRIMQNKKFEGQLPNQILCSNNSSEKLLAFTFQICRTLICQNTQKEDCTCEYCQRLFNNTYYDMKKVGNFIEKIKKSAVQEIIENFSMTALEKPGIKIYIILGADLLTTEAANSLLKFLEEPVQNTYAFLLTTNPKNVLETIRSRCLHIELSPTVFSDKIDENLNGTISQLIDCLIKKQKHNSYLLAREISNFSAEECRDFFSHLSSRIKNSDENFIIQNRILLLEICYRTIEYLNGNFAKDLIVQKAIIELNRLEA